MNTITCITNIYNEEYLLPFWLNHHKKIFDKIIIVDHHSTDNSVKICKEIIPDCEIIPHPSKEFASKEHDIYLMELERKIEGIKIILNTTEFLLCNKPINKVFENNKKQSIGVSCWSPYSLNEYNPQNNYELFRNLSNKDIKFHNDRWFRYIHNYPDGNYQIGRHFSNHNIEHTNDMHIVWFGFYPLNEKLLERKLHVKDNIPLTDRKPRPGFPNGFAWQHFFNKEKLLNINKSKTETGKTIWDVHNQHLFDNIKKIYIDIVLALFDK